MNVAETAEVGARGSGQRVDFEVQRSANPASAAERAALMVDPGFGRVFTDHMVTIRYAEGKGWYEARVRPREPLSLDPATAVLHYAQEIFEGLKAYRVADGSVTLFRADANARRFATSALRMAMAPLPPELFLGSIHELLKIDHAWVPTDPEGSLYLRPFMYASEPFLGVKPSTEYVYVLIASPVGSYFKGGLKPVTVWVSPDYTRAAPGGTGAAKCGGNYAASLAAHSEAVANGCDQVVFLDAVHRRYVDEMGGMNVFFVYDDDTLVTPPLTGSILPGITRDSIITLAGEAGYRVEERPLSAEDWRADAVSGRMREAFACGTAAVITPISEVRSREGAFLMGNGDIGRMTASLRHSLVDIQRGRAADPHGWVERVLGPTDSDTATPSASTGRAAGAGKSAGKPAAARRSAGAGKPTATKATAADASTVADASIVAGASAAAGASTGTRKTAASGSRSANGTGTRAATSAGKRTGTDKRAGGAAR